MTIENNRTITAHDLMIRFLELRLMTPNYDDWTEELLSDNPPRLIRLGQLVAMFQAFGIPWGPRSFVHGMFIQPDTHRYDSLLSKLSAELLKGITDCDWTDHTRVRSFFEILFDYRIRVESVLSYSGNILTASGLFRLALDKICELSRIIRNNIVNIDDIMAAVISPEMTTFSIEQMVRDYGYPDVDVYEIDADWY